MLPTWLEILLKALPAFVKFVMEVIALIKDRPQVTQRALKEEMWAAVRERRLDKLQALRDRLKHDL